MPSKLKIEDVTVGLVAEATFWPNPVAESEFRFRATHLDGRRAPKVVLCDDPRIKPGVPCRIKVTDIRKPKQAERGLIGVELVETLDFKLQGVWLDPIASRQLRVLLESGLNILLDGPQGCGKTTLAKSIADSMGLEFIFFNCSAVIDSTDFLATIQVRASDTGQPVTDFVKTDLLRGFEDALEHPNRSYLIFLDELNRCNEHARNALMPALDSSRKIFNPITNGFLTIPDNVQFIAAVNRGRSFSATHGIDAAQLDRFAPLQLDYLPPEEELKLLAGRHAELSEDLIEKIVAIADTLRKSDELMSGLSVRATDEVCTYLKHPLMQDDAAAFGLVLRNSFCGRYNGRWDDPTTDAGVAYRIIRDDDLHKKK